MLTFFPMVTFLEHVMFVEIDGVGQESIKYSLRMYANAFLGWFVWMMHVESDLRVVVSGVISTEHLGMFFNAFLVQHTLFFLGLSKVLTELKRV